MSIEIGDMIYFLAPTSLKVQVGTVLDIDANGYAVRNANGYLRVTQGYYYPNHTLLGPDTPIYMSRQKAEKEAFLLSLKGERK